MAWLAPMLGAGGGAAAGAEGAGAAGGMGAGGWSGLGAAGTMDDGGMGGSGTVTPAGGSGGGGGGGGGMFGGIMNVATGKNVMGALANSDLTMGQGRVYGTKIAQQLGLMGHLIDHPAAAIAPNSGQNVSAAPVKSTVPLALSQLLSFRGR